VVARLRIGTIAAERARMLERSFAIVAVLSAPAIAGSLHATVVDGQTLQPVAHATARIGSEELVVGDQGELALELAGPVELAVAAPGYEPTTQTIGPGDDGTLVLLFREHALDEVVEIHAQAPRPASEGGYLLTRDELDGLPGATSDALAAVRSLPGVGSASTLAAGRLVIRGGAPQDSLLSIDGVPVPFIYHSFDNTTVLPVGMIGAIAYSPGGFGVEDGRATSGAVAIETSDVPPPRASAQGSLSLLDAQATAALPLGHGVSLVGGVRRSTVDLLIPFAVPANVMVGFPTPPRYYDGQLELDWSAGAHDRVRVLALSSYDRLGIVNETVGSDLPTDFSSSSKFGRLIATWKHETPELRNRLVGALGDGELHATYDSLQHVDSHDALALVRDDLQWAPARFVRVRAGGLAELQHDDLDARSVLVGPDGLPPGHFSDLPIKTIATGVDANYAAAYAAADAMPTPSTTLTAGARVEYFGHIRAAVAEPRASLSQRAGEVLLRAAVGQYARDPSQLEGIPTDLRPERATQVTGGADVDLGEGLTASASAYHTWRSVLAIEDATRMTDASTLPFASTGSGTSSGVDLLLRLHRDGLFGWIGYSFGRSWRRDTPEMALHRSPFDQTHLLTAVASYRRGAWQLGGRFQYATGLPYTDVVGATYSDELGRYVPMLGLPYAARYPAVTQLDVRIEHVWHTRRMRIAGFIDVVNVFRDAAVQRYTYSADFSSRTALTTYVPLPSLGVRGEI
jgi:hypothetical protein